MTHRTESLWSLEIQPEIQSPNEILETQADLLRTQTEGLLAAEVGITREADEPAVCLTLDIAVPGLAGSRHRLLTARHPSARVYPCLVETQLLALADVAYSHEEFRDTVRQVLQSANITSLVLSLMTEAKKTRRPTGTSSARRHPGHKRLYRPAWIGVGSEEENEAWAITFLDEPQGID
jgi:hypothetical protein